MSLVDPLVVDTATRVFERHCGLTSTQTTTADGFAADLWRDACSTGLTRALIDDADERPTSTGSLASAVAVARAAGYAAAPIPLVEAMLAQRLLSDSKWVDEATDDSDESISIAFVAMPGITYDRTLRHVPWGRYAASIYSVMPGPQGFVLARYTASQLRIEHGSDVAGQPMDQLTVLDDAPTRPFKSRRTTDDVLAWAALLRAAQMVGAMERTFDLALEHANTRVQFGRSIGKFQMVQQMLAQHANEVAAATAAVDLAADCTEWAALHFYAGVAKARASEAAGVVSEFAHQVIAAMGFATEFPLHLFTRRLWSWRDDYGTERFWNEMIGRVALGAAADEDGGGLWRLLADGPAPHHEAFK